MIENQQKKIITALSYFLDVEGEARMLFEKPKSLGSAASLRIQLLPAIRAIERLNFQTEILSLHAKNPETFDLLQKSEVCLIGKLSSNSPESMRDMTIANLAGISLLKSSGSTIVVQYCDNTFHRKDIIYDLYKYIFSVADHIVFPSKALQKMSSRYVNSKTTQSIILDPWQVPLSHIPQKMNSNEVRLIWYGSNKNIWYLLDLFESIFSFQFGNINFELTVLGTPFSHEQVKKKIRMLQSSRSNWKLRLVPWLVKLQPKQLESELDRAHISLIPSDPNDPAKAGVSHNRLVDSIRGGCISIASPMESYKELKNIALIGHNIPLLIKQAIENYDKYCVVLSEKREKCLKRFDPEVNSSNWENFWGKVVNIDLS